MIQVFRRFPDKRRTHLRQAHKYLSDLRVLGGSCGVWRNLVQDPADSKSTPVSWKRSKQSLPELGKSHDDLRDCLYVAG